MIQVQAKDLRIGNTIQWLHEEHETFHNVDIEIISQIDKYNKDPYDDIFSRGFWFAPIDLTPEILVKLGFKLMNSVSMSYKKYTSELDNECIWATLSSVGNNQPWLITYTYKSENAKIKNTVSYLHELQNLYYALTGEELDFKP